MFVSKSIFIFDILKIKTLLKYAYTMYIDYKSLFLLIYLRFYPMQMSYSYLLIQTIIVKITLKIEYFYREKKEKIMNFYLKKRKTNTDRWLFFKPLRCI